MIDLVVARAELPATFRQLLDLYDHHPVPETEAARPATTPAIVP